jgi:hypothetical protein
VGIDTPLLLHQRSVGQLGPVGVEPVRICARSPAPLEELADHAVLRARECAQRSPPPAYLSSAVEDGPRRSDRVWLVLITRSGHELTVHSIGASILDEAILHARLPDAPLAELVSATESTSVRDRPDEGSTSRAPCSGSFVVRASPGSASGWTNVKALEPLQNLDLQRDSMV